MSYSLLSTANPFVMITFCIVAMVMITNAQPREDLWHYKMDATSADWSGSPVIISSSGTNCPNANGKDYCWDINSQTIQWDQSTGTGLENYHTIQLMYSISTTSVSASKLCILEYSVNNASIFNDIFRTTGNDILPSQLNDQTFSFGNPSVLSIRLTSSSGNTHCYTNEFIVSGIPITSNPSSSPTTIPSAQPTTIPSLSPTNNPSSSPTTASPTLATDNPSSSPTYVTDNPSSSPTMLTAIPSLSPTIPTANPSAYAANSGCNGVEYEISGISYFEPVDACVNNLVYFCDGDVLKRRACALQSHPRSGPDMSDFTTDESAITTDVCNAITTEKSANACKTYCDGESCSAVVETLYPIIPYDMFGCSGEEYCVRDSTKICSLYWQSEQSRLDITGGAATQTVHMTNRCVDSSMYSCRDRYNNTHLYAHKTNYSQPDCTGEATAAFVKRLQCHHTNDTSTLIDEYGHRSTPPCQPISYGCYVYKTASPTGVPTASTKAPSAFPTTAPSAPPTTSAPSAPPTTSVPSAPPTTSAPSALPTTTAPTKATMNPTIQTTNPTTAPAILTTRIPCKKTALVWRDGELVEIDECDLSPTIANDSSQMADDTLFVGLVVIGIVAVTALVICACTRWYLKRKNRKERSSEEDANNIEANVENKDDVIQIAALIQSGHWKKGNHMTKKSDSDVDSEGKKEDSVVDEIEGARETKGDATTKGDLDGVVQTTKGDATDAV